MGAFLSIAHAHRQQRCRAIESLDLRFFIDAEYNGVVRWCQVEADDVGNFGFQLGVGGELMSSPGFDGDSFIWFRSLQIQVLRGRSNHLEMIGSKRLGSRSAKRAMGPECVEPMHPFGCRDLDIVNALPRASVADQLGLVQ